MSAYRNAHNDIMNVMIAYINSIVAMACGYDGLHNIHEASRTVIGEVRNLHEEYVNVHVAYRNV